MCTRIVCLCRVWVRVCIVVVSVNISNCLSPTMRAILYVCALESLSIHNSVVNMHGVSRYRRVAVRCGASIFKQSNSFMCMSQPVQKKFCEHIQCQCILPRVRENRERVCALYLVCICQSSIASYCWSTCMMVMVRTRLELRRFCVGLGMCCFDREMQVWRLRFVYKETWDGMCLCVWLVLKGVLHTREKNKFYLQIVDESQTIADLGSQQCKMILLQDSDWCVCILVFVCILRSRLNG